MYGLTFALHMHAAWCLSMVAVHVFYHAAALLAHGALFQLP